MTVSRRGLMANAVALGALASAGACNRNNATASDALGDLDATGIAAAIRDGSITAGQALEAAIARSESVNTELNFIATPLYEYGRTRAGEQLSGPFAGVPTLIKDLMPMTGQPTKYGSRAFAENVAQEQPPYMDALLAAGLVPFGKSTTPEFGLTATTETLLSGPNQESLGSNQIQRRVFGRRSCRRCRARRTDRARQRRRRLDPHPSFVQRPVRPETIAWP
jgi:amidase